MTRAARTSDYSFRGPDSSRHINLNPVGDVVYALDAVDEVKAAAVVSRNTSGPDERDSALRALGLSHLATEPRSSTVQRVRGALRTRRDKEKRRRRDGGQQVRDSTRSRPPAEAQD